MRLMIPEYSMGGGIETLNVQLIREFLPLVERIVLVAPSHRIGYFRRILPRADNLTFEPMYWERPAPQAYVDALAKRFLSGSNESGIGKKAERFRKDLVQSRFRHLVAQHGITHCFCTWIFREEVPAINVPIGAVLMDVNWRVFPENFPESKTQEIDRYFGAWLREADVMFPISQFTESLTQKMYEIPFRSVVVPHGSEGITPSSSNATATAEAANPGETPYFYYPASVYAHKRHIQLFEAAVRLYQEGYDFRIVLSGGRTQDLLADKPFERPEIEEWRQFLRRHADVIAGRIEGRGYVEWAEVERLYAGCRAVVLSSGYEGFGLPLVEALERGAPVICSDIPPFLEQIELFDSADSVRVYPKDSADALAQAMQGALQETERKVLPPARIQERLSRWTWKSAALRYLDSLAAVK